MFYRKFLSFLLGPLTYNNNGRATLVGVVSWGIGCASPGYPGVYARVTEALGFINDQLAQGCTASGPDGYHP